MRDVVIAALAFAYSVWAIAGAGDDIVTKGFVLLLRRHPGLHRDALVAERGQPPQRLRSPPAAAVNGRRTRPSAAQPRCR